MKLPKQISTDVRYISASAFNCLISFLQPNAGQEPDGTPFAPVVVRTNVHANVAQWRGKEADKTDSRVAISSYKIIIRYPKSWTVDSGMEIMVRNQLHEIESISDPDGRQVELHLWTSVTNDVTDGTVV
jgi:SPP1 family predicted phage head-tail adaptor